MNQLNAMITSFTTANRQFTHNLERSIHTLEENIDTKAEMKEICSDEWYLATQDTLDDMAKVLYSMSALKLIAAEDSQKISNLRNKVSNLHDKYITVLAENGDFLPVSCGMHY